jgi:hypothetical protein
MGQPATVGEKRIIVYVNGAFTPPAVSILMVIVPSLTPAQLIVVAEIGC